MKDATHLHGRALRRAFAKIIPRSYSLRIVPSTSGEAFVVVDRRGTPLDGEDALRRGVRWWGRRLMADPTIGSSPFVAIANAQTKMRCVR